MYLFGGERVCVLGGLQGRLPHPPMPGTRGRDQACVHRR